MRPGLCQLPLAGHQAAPLDALQDRELTGGGGLPVQDISGLQSAQHLGGGGRAVLGVLAEQAEDQGIEGGRNALVPGARRDGGGVQVLGDDGQRVVGQEGQAAGDQFVEHDAQGVEVGAAVVRLAQRQFRCQVKDGAGDGAFDRNAGGDAPGQAEIAQLGGGTRPRQGILAQQDVLRLEVAVDDAPGVGVLQGGAHLAGDGQDLFQRSRAAIVQRRALHQLHDDKWQRARGVLAVRDPGFSCIVDGDDVGVIEPGSRLGLAKQAGAALGAQPGG